MGSSSLSSVFLNMWVYNTRTNTFFFNFIIFCSFVNITKRTIVVSFKELQKKDMQEINKRTNVKRVLSSKGDKEPVKIERRSSGEHDVHSHKVEQCRDRNDVDCKKAPLEVLPQDILIRILCGVNHEDLKQFFHVSKAIREATLTAKRCHFAYSTPSKTCAFRNAIDLADCSEVDAIEAPDAPKQTKQSRSRLGG